ncbi:MAG: hypothetical protein BM564_12455 [Bacteroidetes bacterium MedPE-SWsnd-G2]|nr:MAG: hypothetical protein BM564_12455 [Bacteroidetes bacterium MedPE-SWsnd-G2]
MTNTQSSGLLKVISKFMALLIFILGIVVIIGWYTKNLTLLQILPDAVAMQYNTALGFLISGMGLYAALKDNKRIVTILAILLTALGGLTLSQYIFGWDLGIDEFFMDHYITNKVSHKGRMAPNTAFCFLLTGIILLVYANEKNIKRRSSIVGLLGGIVMFMGTLAFMGYFIGFEEAYTWGKFTKMAVHTAFGFMAVGIGVLVGLWYATTGKQWIESSITRRLSFYIILPLSLLYLFLASYNIYLVKMATFEESYLKLKEISWHNTNILEKKLSNVEEVARATRRFLMTQSQLEESEIHDLLENEVSNNENIQSLIIAFAPYAYRKTEKLYAPYAYKNKGQTLFMDFGKEAYDYTDETHQWYQQPILDSKGVWSDPFLDETITNTWMITYSLPVFKFDEVWAVVAIDIPVSNFDTLFVSEDLQNFAYGVLSSTGNYIFTSYNNQVIGQSIYEQGDSRSMRQSDRTDLAEEMLKGNSGYKEVDLIGGDSFQTIYNPIEIAEWVFFMGVNRSEIMAPIQNIIFRMSLFFILMLLLFITIIYFVSKQLTQQLLGLNKATDQIIEGNLDTKFKRQSNDEIGDLSQNFAIMTSKLKNREQELKSLNEELEEKVIERTQQLENAVDELKTNQLITKESEQKFKALFNSTTLPLCYVDEAGEFELINEQFTEVFGYTIEDTPNLEAWWIKAYPDPKYRARVLEKWNEVTRVAKASNSNIESNEYKVTCKSGQEKTVIIGGTIINDNFLATFYDVTERKEAEEQIARSEKLFKSLVRTMPGVVYRCGLTSPWDMYFISDEIERFTGYTSASFLGENPEMTFDDIVHPEDREQISKNVTQAIENNLPIINEYRILHKNGTYRYVRSQGQSNYKTDGSPEFLVGTIFDISERKQLEIEIQKERAQLQEFLDYSPIAVIISVDGEAKYTNRKFHEVFGLSTGDSVKNRYINEKAREDLMLKLQDENALTGYQIQYYNKEQEVIDALLSTNKINFNGEDALLSWVVDISELKAIEKDLKDAKEQADQANQSKSSFLANMSHEIRTPMNAVLGFSELLEKLVQSDIEKSYVSSIKSSGKSLLWLINDILDFSKIEAGKIELDLTYFNLEILLEEMRSIFSLKVQDKGLKLNIEIDEHTPKFVKTDEIRLRQILINLINNAVKFTEEGEIKIKVDGLKPKDEHIDLRISVQDTGIGISDSFKKNLFHTFTQQDGEITKKFGGTGLGLAISKNLAELMNGDLLVESEEGIGSTFSLVLKNIEFTNEGIYKESETQTDLGHITFDQATILIVDDVIDNRKYIKGALSHYNFILLEAENGIEALDIMAKTTINLVITDLRMPKMDGFTFIKTIKENKKFSDIPIIGTSASVMEFNIEKAKRYKFDEFLTKPVKVQELVSCMAKFLPSNITSNSEDIIESNSNSKITLTKTQKTSFLNELDNLVSDNNKLKEHQAMDDFHAFSDRLLKVGTTYNVQGLIDYSKSLQTSIDSFDIENLLKLITKFNAFVESLKSKITS